MESGTIEELCKAVITAGAVGGVVVLTPAFLATLGFGAAGIVAGSIAAKLMSVFGASWLIASLQSIGAAGFGWFGTSVLGVSGAFAGKILSFVCNITVEVKNDS